MKHRYGHLLLDLGLVVMWSSGYIGAKLASETRSVLLVLFWRFLLIALLLTPVSIRHVIATGARPFLINALLGFCGMFLQIGCAVIAIDRGISAGTLSIIYSLQPLVTAAVAGPVLGEQVTKLQWLGLAVAFAGISITTGYGGLDAPWPTYLLTGLGVVGIVAATMISKVSEDATPLLPAIGIQSGTSALLFLPLAMLDVGLAPPADDQMFWLSVGWFMLFSTLGAYGFYWACLRRSSAVHVGTVLYLTPVLTIIVTGTIFGEPITLSKVAGLAICLVGVAISLKPARVGS